MEFSYINLLFLLGFYGLVLFSLYYMKKKNIPLFIPVVFLLIISLSFGLYVRGIVHSGEIFATTDEANYLAKFFECRYESDCGVSGPGYIQILSLFYSLFPNSLNYGLMAFSLLVSAIYLPVIFLTYRILLKDDYYSYLSTLILGVTSYFIYPLVEGRPQQIGMLLLFFLVVYINSNYYKNNPFKGSLILILSLLFLFYFHILSFLFAVLLLIAIVGIKHIRGAKTINSSHILFLTLLLGLTLFGFSIGPYDSLSSVIEWTFSNSSNSLISTSASYYPFNLFLGISLLYLVYLLFLFLFRKLYPYILEMKVKINSTITYFLGIVLAYASFLVLLSQYVIGESIFSVVYNHSLALFLLFQLGNILFGGLFIIGIYCVIKSSKNEETHPLLEACFGLLGIGLLGLSISFFLGENFNNWLIRVLNYFTLFAGPIVALVILKKAKEKKFLIPLLVLFIIPSLILASWDSSFFNIKTSWNTQDITAITWLRENAKEGSVYYIVSSETDGYVGRTYNWLYNYISYRYYHEKVDIGIETASHSDESWELIYEDNDLQIYSII